jgi:hypothetical protein
MPVVATYKIGYVPYCRSIGEDDDLNLNYASMALLSFIGLCAGTQRRSSFRPGSHRSAA